MGPQRKTSKWPVLPAGELNCGSGAPRKIAATSGTIRNNKLSWDLSSLRSAALSRQPDLKSGMIGVGGRVIVVRSARQERSFSESAALDPRQLSVLSPLKASLYWIRAT
jgi:hypothetical protein